MGKRFTALLIGVLLCAVAAHAYAGAGYNREYWYAGAHLGNGIDRFGYGSYDGMLRYGGGEWQTAYRRGSPYYDGAMLWPTNARYGYGVVSPRYGQGVISPRYGYQYQSPRRNWN